MAATHDLPLLESEENDIRWAANEDAEQERIRLINQVTQLITENLRLKNAARKYLTNSTPSAYYMDEWHELKAALAGTPNEKLSRRL